jgi:hypothetical protein
VKEIKPAIFIAYEAGRAVVATLNDVNRYVGQHEARASWHARVNGSARISVDGKTWSVPD